MPYRTAPSVPSTPAAAPRSRRYQTHVRRRRPGPTVVAILVGIAVAVAMVLSSRQTAHLECRASVLPITPSCTLVWKNGLGRPHQQRYVDVPALLADAREEVGSVSCGPRFVRSAPPPIPAGDIARIAASYEAFVEPPSDGLGERSPALEQRWEESWSHRDHAALFAGLAFALVALLSLILAGDGSRIELDLDGLVVRVRTKAPFGRPAEQSYECPWARTAEVGSEQDAMGSYALSLIGARGQRQELCRASAKDAERAAAGLNAVLRAERKRRHQGIDGALRKRRARAVRSAAAGPGGDEV